MVVQADGSICITAPGLDGKLYIGLAQLCTRLDSSDGVKTGQITQQ